MKRLTVFLLSVFITLNIFAQQGITWVSIGVKGGFGTSTLFNYSSFMDDAVQYNFFTPSYSYGGKLGFSFNGGLIGISLEGLNNTWGHSYSVNNVNHSVKISSWSFGIIMKIISQNGIYFELGPQYNIVNSLKTDQMQINANDIAKYSSAAIGLGFMPVFGERVELSIGLRGMVSLGTILNDAGLNLYNDSPNFANYANYNNIGVILVPMISFNYVFAYMGRASCGKFRIMLNQ